MPIVGEYDFDKKEYINKYDFPGKYLEEREEGHITDSLKAWRKEYIKEQELFIMYQKQCKSKEDAK